VYLGAAVAVEDTEQVCRQAERVGGEAQAIEVAAASEQAHRRVREARGRAPWQIGSAASSFCLCVGSSTATPPPLELCHARARVPMASGTAIPPPLELRTSATPEPATASSTTTPSRWFLKEDKACFFFLFSKTRHVFL
jgi:hypothetical protein